MNIYDRAHQLVSLDHFANTGEPLLLGSIALRCPEQRQYILRMPIRIDGGNYLLPQSLLWLRKLIIAAGWHNHKWLGCDHDYCYVTVRHGIVDSVTDDEWHVDGFSTRVPHVPEQNYIWCSDTPTEYVPLCVNVPADFDPLVHNINTYLSARIGSARPVRCDAGRVYCLDPYILHRRPPASTGTMRTFVRVSFVPIEIDDVNNTQNPLLPRRYSRDGVQFRNTLLRYPDGI